jgi:peptidoglycan hydrolase-like protein with peptidoglycan-binding domain
LVYEVQTLLKQLGYNPGPVDGINGGKTKAAIEQFEKDIGRYPQGRVTEDIRRLLNERLTRTSNATIRTSVRTSGAGSFQADTGERQAIDIACAGKKALYGPAGYYNCADAMLNEPSHIGRRPDYSGVNYNEEAALENACSGKTSLYG